MRFTLNLNNIFVRRLLEWEEARWGINGRLPEHYLQYYFTWKQGPQVRNARACHFSDSGSISLFVCLQEWIHARKKEGRFEKDEFGQVVEVVNANVPAFYPDAFHKWVLQSSY